MICNTKTTVFLDNNEQAKKKWWRKRRSTPFAIRRYKQLRCSDERKIFSRFYSVMNFLQYNDLLLSSIFFCALHVHFSFFLDRYFYGILHAHIPTGCIFSCFSETICMPFSSTPKWKLYYYYCGHHRTTFMQIEHWTCIMNNISRNALFIGFISFFFLFWIASPGIRHNHFYFYEELV